MQAPSAVWEQGALCAETRLSRSSQRDPRVRAGHRWDGVPRFERHISTGESCASDSLSMVPHTSYYVGVPGRLGCRPRREVSFVAVLILSAWTVRGLRWGITHVGIAAAG